MSTAPGPRSTSSVSAVVSTVASTCPAVTVWPAFTLTAVTVPETAKLRLAWLAGSMVPELATVCWMVPVVTGTVTVVIDSPTGRRRSRRQPERRGRSPPPRQRRPRRHDGPAVAAPEGRRLGSEHVLVVERQFLGADPPGPPTRQLHPVFAMGPVQTSHFTASRIPAVSPLGVLPRFSPQGAALCPTPHGGAQKASGGANQGATTAARVRRTPAPHPTAEPATRHTAHP